MAGGIIKRYWDSTLPFRNKLSRCWDARRVVRDMETGGCLDEFAVAVVMCDRDFEKRIDDDISFVDKKPAEVVPADLHACVKATAALRRCMQANPGVFRERVVAMDEGIKEDVKRRREPDVEVEDGHSWRWWTGMRNA